MREAGRAAREGSRAGCHGNVTAYVCSRDRKQGFIAYTLLVPREAICAAVHRLDGYTVQLLVVKLVLILLLVLEQHP